MLFKALDDITYSRITIFFIIRFLLLFKCVFMYNINFNIDQKKF